VRDPQTAMQLCPLHYSANKKYKKKLGVVSSKAKLMRPVFVG